MAATDAPTRPSGVLGTGAVTSSWGIAADALEHVGDLVWPISVRTYARMRHDPTLASVLQAYRLPIIKARWEIDPRGASPRMVQVCADSLGLPVRGAPDDPGPVRRRGVQWLAHLRAALGMLTFGHAAFEPIYEVRGSDAYLAGIPERLQLSIAEIDIDDQGDMLRIKQYGDIGRPTPSPIPADRLLWYVHEREGAAWTGQSMLRAAFGAWLLKQDALRTGGAALRRFGSGIPQVKWDAGAQPTAAQGVSALQAAQNARGGDTAAVQMPPGAELRIAGVQGTFPDALAYARYYDEQMARAALASMLDLGSTANGSRALGDTFADLLMLAQQGVAEQIAETATSLCTRLTDFNEGEDSPAPAVVVGDVGSSRQVVAHAIAELVRFGAVMRDDALENWIRDSFDAPEREKPTPDTPPAPAPVPGQQIPPPPAPAGAPGDQGAGSGQDGS